MCVARGENLERRHLGRRHWGIGTDGRIWNQRKKVQCKGSVNDTESWTFLIPSCRWNSRHFLEEIRFWEHPPCYRTTQTEEKNKEILQENQTGLQHLFKAHRRMMLNQETAYGPFQRTTITVIMWKTWVKLYVPSEESFPIPLKHIDVTRTTDTTLDVMSEKHIDDYGNVDGNRELSDAWASFTRFILLNEKPPDGYTWSGRRLTRKQTTSRHDNVWPGVWKHMFDSSTRKEKQKWLSRNQSSIMEGDYVVVTSLILMTRNSSLLWKMLVESWKLDSLTHCSLLHKYIPMPQASKFQMQRRQWWENVKKLEKIRRKWSKKQGIMAEKFILRHWLICVISRIRSWNLDIKNIKVESYFEVTLCKRWFWFVCRICWARIISITNDSRKNHGYHLQTSRMRRTSSRRSIGLCPSKNGRCSKIIENSQIGMSRHLNSSTTTQMA